MSLPDYLESSAKDFARQLTASTSTPINTGTFTGRSFVAGEDPLQTQAITAATQGIGSYQPFLTQAQAVGQDVFIAPKSKKAVKVMEDLIEEGYDITKDAEGEYIINSLDEGALDLIAKRLRLGGKDIDEFMGNYDDYYSGGDDKMIFDALRDRKADGGIMDLGGLEKDYREGGFVPLGAEERADDVPARLSKNEFVFTADAVRNAGQGDIDKGAEVMQNMMDNLESGGTISEESQGMENPAQEMFDQSQLLESRIA